MSESYILQKTPPDESIKALDTILGEGASAEFLAQWLYRVDCGESGMRSYPDDHVRKLLAKQGSAALPALHRVFSIQKPTDLEVCKRYRWYVYWAMHPFSWEEPDRKHCGTTFSLVGRKSRYL
jgi:hypothetical protein